MDRSGWRTEEEPKRPPPLLGVRHPRQCETRFPTRGQSEPAGFWWIPTHRERENELRFALNETGWDSFCLPHDRSNLASRGTSRLPITSRLEQAWQRRMQRIIPQTEHGAHLRCENG